MRLLDAETRGRVLGYLLSCALMLSAALNVWLAYQLGSSRAQARITGSPPSGLSGKTLPTLAGHRLDDFRPAQAAAAQETAETVSFEGNDCNVLYLFAERCQWCEKNLPKASELHRELDALGARVIALSFDQDQAQLKQYVDRAMPSFEVLSELSDDSRAALRVPGTPWTAAVDASGKVLAEWPGAYDDRVVESIVSLCKRQIAKG